MLSSYGSLLVLTMPLRHAATICIPHQACKEDLIGSDSAELTATTLSRMCLLAQLCSAMRYKRPFGPAQRPESSVH